MLYNLEQRGIEWELLPWCRERGMPLMAYSPLGSDSRRLRTHPVLKAMAARLGATPARIALAWLLRQPDVVVIPKASSEAHVRDNHAALELALTADDLAELDARLSAAEARDAARDDLSRSTAQRRAARTCRSSLKRRVPNQPPSSLPRTR